MYVPVESENINVLMSNFNIRDLDVNDDFMEVFNHDHIKIYYFYDFGGTFEPVIECKAFNTKNFILNLRGQKEFHYCDIDDYYFTYFSDKFNINIINDLTEDQLREKIVRMYFEIVKCIRYESL